MMISRRESSACPVRVVAPYELTRTIKVRQRDAGKTLLELFSERFPYIPEQEWLWRIEQGWLSANGTPLTPEYRIGRNMHVEHYSPRVKEPAVASGVQILQETDQWLAVYKPAPLPMHPGGRYNKNSLSVILEEMGYEKLHIVHRLDAVTSGIVMFSRNREFAFEIHRAFESGKVEKWYYARVHGRMESPISVSAPIRRKRGFVFECGRDLQGAKPAVTHFYPEQYEEGVTWVRCVPVTGRTHQIRLHAAHSGFPILDDPIYGPMGDDSGRRLQNCAISLCSAGFVVGELDIGVEVSLERLLSIS